MNNQITTEWPIYQAEGYLAIFMYDHYEKLRWFPNPETLSSYGYEFGDKIVVPISWFYDKPIVSSILDILTGSSYPAEETPNYQLYLGEIGQYSCYLCEASFATQQELDTHLSEAHWISRAHPCPYCGATFSSQAELDAHIATVHIAGPVDWFKQNWKLVVIGGGILAVAITGVAVAASRKK